MGDIQNTGPVFLGSLTGVIREDDPIGTLVMTVQARDGDRGEPRKIYYELVTSKSPQLIELLLCAYGPVTMKLKCAFYFVLKI